MGEVELKETTGEVFAQLSGQFVFTYGMFGFGESFQVKTLFFSPYCLSKITFLLSKFL